MTGLDHAPRAGRAGLIGRRPVLRVALLGISVALVGFTVIVSDTAWRTHRYDTARARATAVADGTVVEDRYYEHFDLRARWVDASGREHVQRFEVDHRYRVGERFTVAYDPNDPSPRGFPADSGTDRDNDIPLLFLGYAAAVAVGVPLWWAIRGLRFRHAAEHPGRAMVAHPRVGKDTAGAGITHPSTWLILNDIGNPVPYGWQRVMWHPAVEQIPDRAEAIVRGRASESGPVGPLAVELPGGVRLTPIGKVRREPPRRFRLTSRPGVRVDVGPGGSIVIVREDPPPHPRRWWRRTPRLVLVGTLLGGALGYGLDGAVTVIPGAVLMSTILLTGWMLSGGEP
ncbi:DUF3592 domain-containing protein [Parafrankia elaeagni]|uniref:DUF3592 domain-containing protein n=1 Tax=Parafrankia elaeagni TaxID=222534 RepID=UPI00037E306F|nr:DUF3592 domain-containing protein [Parafrankia elaeagni]